MALYATNRFPGDGVTTSYEFNFAGKYIARPHVKVYQEDNATGARTPVAITDSNFLNDTTLRNLPATPVGKTLVIYRDTPKPPLVDFTNGARLTEANLDTATRQGSFIAVESADAISTDGLAGFINCLEGFSRGAETARDQAAVSAGQAAASASTATAKATEVVASAVAAGLAKDTAVAAAGAIGPIKFYDTRALATAALGSRADGDLIEVAQDETRAGARTRYVVSGGALVFVVNLDQTKLALAAAVVSVKDFGAVGDGVTNDSTAIQAALDSLGSGGGTVTIVRGMKCLVDTSLVVPANCSLVGPHVFVGSPQDNASAPYQNLGGALIVNSSTTITMKGGSCLSGLLIYRKGMTFPATDTSQFAGVAVTADDDDVVVQNSMILGFSKAYYSNGHQRARIHQVYMDNINGVEIAQCYDIAYVTECHCWPFATIARPGAPLIRSGRAYYFRDGGDWNKLTNCFSYGYLRGLEINAADSITVSGCGFDNVPGGHPNSIGISVVGACVDTRIINCQTAAQATAGIFINTSGGASNRVTTTIQGHNVWGGSSHGVLIYDGDVLISGSGFRNVTNAVSVTTAASIVNFDNNWVRDISGCVINPSVETVNVHLGPNNEFFNFAGDPTGNLKLPAVASAPAIQIPSTGHAFSVTGTTSFGTLRHSWAGRVVTLVLTDNISVLHSSAGTGHMRLNNKTDFAAVNGSSITLMGVDGGGWVEIGRSA